MLASKHLRRCPTGVCISQRGPLRVGGSLGPSPGYQLAARELFTRYNVATSRPDSRSRPRRKPPSIVAKGDYKIPHSIRIDHMGDVWTVDAGSSTVIKYSALGKRPITITVGEQPDNGSPFNGTTDVAFGLNGRIFI